MPLDPSIPLGIKLYSFLDDEAKRQQIAASQQEMAARRQQMETERATREAYGQLFGGGDSVGGTMSRPSAAAMGNLARVNPEAAFKIQQHFASLDEDSRKREAGKYKVAAPVLLQAQQMPYEQRRQFIQAASPALMASGWTQQELAGFDPTDQNVRALSSAAMTVGEVVDANKIDWHPIGENGSFATNQMGNPTGSGNPFAPQGQPQGGTAPPQSNDLNGVFQSLIQQESGGQAGIRGQQTAYGVPLGRTQLLPKTGQEMAGKLGVPWQPELLTGTSPQASTYQDKLGRAYFDEGLQKYGGNIEKALMYYHGGPDERKWGPKTRTYAKTVLARANKSGARRISSQAERDSLPSGTQYIAPDGTLRTKS